MKIQLGQLALHVFLLTVAVITLIPLVWIGSMALKSPLEVFMDPFGLPNPIRWENLWTAWTVGKFNEYFFNSVLVSVPMVALAVAFSTSIAYGLAILKLPGSRAVLSVFLLGIIIPVQAIMIPLYYQLTSLGLINSRPGLILAEVAFLGIPFGVFFMRSFFMTMPKDLLDAALIDGCSDIQALYYVIAPISKPALSTLVVIFFLWSWNEFLLPLILIQDDALRTIPVGLMFLQGGKYTINYSMVAAGVVIASVPTLLAYIIFQRRFIEGLTAGALKG